MRIGIVMDDELGMEGNVSAHFGQCRYFLLADIDGDGNTVIRTEVVPNTLSHGGGGCLAVDALLGHGITHVIAGGMGMSAQVKFERAGVTVYGSSGRVKDSIAGFLRETLGGIDPCKEHGEECH